ncbi:TlpA family protein disulfide reductase [Kordia periserrulae]|nr:thioredoxin-like domain-containing protein [Kordia periserrulae]
MLLKKNRWKLGYLCCVFIILYACQQKKKSSIPVNNTIKKDINVEVEDSLKISISFNTKGFTDLNLVNNYFHFEELKFDNTKQKDTIITHKIKKNFENQIISFLGFSVINGIPKKHRHHYLIRKETKSLAFTYYQGNILLEDSREGILVDSLFNTYSQISFQIKNSNKQDQKLLKKTLDSLKHGFKESFIIKKDTVLQTLNDYLYYNELQQLNPYEKEIDSFLKNISKPIASRPLSNLLFYYVKNRIEDFTYENLTLKKYSKEYLDVLAIGMFNFLRHENNLGNPKYNAAISWLKTTDLYQKDTAFIQKKIQPLDNKEFKKKLQNLKVFSKDFDKILFSKIMNQYPSDYYLIDFWATWCVPCIEGIKLMETMDFPENVKVISLSIDEHEKREIWKRTTTNLHQEITYLIDKTSPESNDFTEFVELTSIPRYILIDSNMNLIDESFLHPNESNFLSKLNDVKYSKFW